MIYNDRGVSFGKYRCFPLFSYGKRSSKRQNKTGTSARARRCVDSPIDHERTGRKRAMSKPGRIIRVSFANYLRQIAAASAFDYAAKWRVPPACAGAKRRMLTSFPPYNHYRNAGSSLPGKVRGTGIVTLPVAAHSAPRKNVTMKLMLSNICTSCPNAVWKMRPLP